MINLYADKNMDDDLFVLMVLDDGKIAFSCVSDDKHDIEEEIRLSTDSFIGPINIHKSREFEEID